VRVFEHRADAGAEEAFEGRPDIVQRRELGVARVRGVRVLEKLTKIDIDGPFERDANDAECRTTKREGIRRAARDQADSEATDQGVDAVSYSDDRADELVGDDVIGALGSVVIANRVRNGRIDALSHRVPSAHFTLQLRELEYDERLEIGLAQARCLDAGRGVGAGSLRKGAGIGLQAPDLGAHRAQLRLEHDRFELLEPVGERRFPVLLDEELRVGQAGTKDPIVAFGNGFRVLSRVDHVEIRGKQRSAFGRANGEISLVVTHHRDDDGVWELEERFVETTWHGERFFDERNALIGKERVGCENAAQ